MLRKYLLASVKAPFSLLTEKAYRQTYNLSGQYVGKDYKGIVVTAGKKHMRKQQNSLQLKGRT